MKCPKCKGFNDRIVNCRPKQDQEITRRRRECLDCGHRWTTYEIITESVKDEKLLDFLGEEE